MINRPSNGSVFHACASSPFDCARVFIAIPGRLRGPGQCFPRNRTRTPTRNFPSRGEITSRSEFLAQRRTRNRAWEPRIDWSNCQQNHNRIGRLNAPRIRWSSRPEAKIRFGGPVQIQSVRLLVNSATEIPSAERLFADVYFVNSTTTLQLLLADDDAAAINYYAGFSGWSPGQLEMEIARGDWHMIKADGEAIFEQDNTNIWLKWIERLEGTWVLIDNAVTADTPS